MRTSMSVLLIAASFALPSAALRAQNGNIAPPSANNQAAATPNFFEMVTQLAEISAKNRNLQLPEDATSGRRVGQMIKLAAKADTDQLLYQVVDNAVRKVGKPLPTTAQQ